MDNGTPFGTGSRAAHEAAGASSPKASIPGAVAEHIFGAITWCRYQAECAMEISSGAATTHGDESGALQMLNSIGSDIEINLHMLEDFLLAQGIETRSAETERLSPKGESPVGETDAPNLHGQQDRSDDN